MGVGAEESRLQAEAGLDRPETKGPGRTGGTARPPRGKQGRGTRAPPLGGAGPRGAAPATRAGPAARLPLAADCQLPPGAAGPKSGGSSPRLLPADPAPSPALPFPLTFLLI